ncbi:DUF2971 domain-containing protein [uncultured Desulfosarcina sp.]|uniref:DUF2971 domain-containing protein n=1 Tax=uncultured Desulfosarcina sp. TaxID=218289 RepID=UPI0029C8CCCD|nr:DUF2971 domain-containing protein [uncultured Desulfosarcina sp.]
MEKSKIKELINEFENERWSFIEDAYWLSSIGRIEVVHYTMFDTLRSIEKEPVLWLTEYNALNDLSEFKVAGQIITRMYQFYTDERKAGSIDIEQIRGKIEKEELYLLNRIEAHYDKFIKQNTFCCFSFTRKYDDLNQWRYYANDGNGIALTSTVKEVIKAFVKPVEARQTIFWQYYAARPSLKGFFVERCLYGNEVFERLFNHIDRAIKLINGYKIDNANINKLIDGYAEIIAKIIVYYSSLAKQDAFRDEDEIRIVSFFDKKKFQKKCLSRKNRKGIEVRYVKVKMRTSPKNSWIKNIQAGPTLAEKDKSAVAEFCSGNGIDVSYSSIPLR